MAIDLISKLFTYCPRLDYLHLNLQLFHIFDELRDINKLKILQSQMKISIPQLFNFSNQEVCKMTQQEMIQLIHDWYGISSKIIKTEC